jgi:uncharacterized protein (TIGR02996 family)
MSKRAGTNQEQGFLSAICEAPEDHTARLIYADWLDDNGDPDRAEFIRVQCRLANMDDFDPQREELLLREHRLFQAHGKEWGKPVAKITKNVEFLGGFVGRMKLPLGKFLDKAETIFATVPLTGLRPTQVKARWDDLLASPYLARLRSLDLHASALGAGRTEGLARCDKLAGLRELNLGANSITARGTRALLRSRCLPELERLHLTLNRVGNDGFTDLATASFPRLRHLDLSSNHLDAAGARSLVAAGWLSQLETLDLSPYNLLGDEGVRILAESGVWAGLRTLRLSLLTCTLAGVRAVAASPHLANLRELILKGLDRGTGYLGELVRSSGLLNLQRLNLDGGQPTVGDDEIRALVSSPLAPRLRCLGMGGVSPEGVKTLLSAPTLGGLRRLSLGGNFPLSELGKVISAAGHLKNLTRLGLSGSGYAAEAATAIASSPHLYQLAELNLGWHSFTNSDIETLINSPYLTRLRRLCLGTRIASLPDDLPRRLTERFGPGVCVD